MGLVKEALSKIIRPVVNWVYATDVSGNTPIFSQFGTNVYASDVVQQAINCIVSELKKLRIEHIIEKGNDIVPASSSLQAVLNNPNPLMTQSDFLERASWLLLLNYNVFIVPIYWEYKDNKGSTHRKYEALYPIQPAQADFIEDTSKKLFVRFRFENGDSYILKYSDIIHIKTHYSVNEYMGGNEAGQPDNSALLKTLEINHQLLQGIGKAMKATYAVNAVVKYNTMLDEGKTKAALTELEAKLRNNQSGFLPLDLKGEYIPIKKDIKLVDADTLKFIDEKILRHFGVSLPILTGDYNKEQYEAFYQKTIEPLVIAFSQAFTKSLFTDRERAHGNKVQCYPKDLIFMSVEQTLKMIEILSPTGSLFENEKRVAFGLRPLKELEGKRYMSLNWIDADKANKYQVGDGKSGK